jgi:cellulose synthase/poly-beta-1,6-N-acetylglucosamine synthase-like glycosyltransferase
VDSGLPTVSVVIAARPEQKEIKAAESACKLDYPKDRLEIIVARGRHPSAQRNLAIQQAKGKIIYFLDDDSVAPPQALKIGIKHFEDETVAIVGGPNLCPTEAPFIEQVFAVILSSFSAFGPSRARYAKVGVPRQTTEKELILCNLLARKDALLTSGGFDTNLYPNEENALMDLLVKKGYKLIYDPEFYVYRRPRSNLKSFIKMLLNYGRGRAEQFRLHPTAGSILNFVPPLLCLYIMLLAILWTIASHNIAFYASIPFLIYILALLFQTAYSILKFGFVKSLISMPLLMITNICYGLGFIKGLFTKPSPPQKPVIETITIERVSF